MSAQPTSCAQPSVLFSPNSTILNARQSCTARQLISIGRCLFNYNGTYDVHIVSIIQTAVWIVGTKVNKSMYIFHITLHHFSAYFSWILRILNIHIQHETFIWCNKLHCRSTDCNKIVIINNIFIIHVSLWLFLEKNSFPNINKLKYISNHSLVRIQYALISLTLVCLSVCP